MADQKTALTPCERAFKEWLEESGGTPTPQQHNWLWRAFRAGWYARQGDATIDSGKATP